MNTMHTAHELCARTGITYRQLDYWVREGLLPVAATASGPTNVHLPGTVPGGSGYPRLFTTATLNIARLLQPLRRHYGLDELKAIYAGLNALKHPWPRNVWITPDATLHRRRPHTPLALYVDLHAFIEPETTVAA